MGHKLIVEEKFRHSSRHLWILGSWFLFRFLAPHVCLCCLLLMKRSRFCCSAVDGLISFLSCDVFDTYGAKTRYIRRSANNGMHLLISVCNISPWNDHLSLGSLRHRTFYGLRFTTFFPLWLHFLLHCAIPSRSLDFHWAAVNGVPQAVWNFTLCDSLWFGLLVESLFSFSVLCCIFRLRATVIPICSLESHSW